MRPTVRPPADLPTLTATAGSTMSSSTLTLSTSLPLLFLSHFAAPLHLLLRAPLSSAARKRQLRAWLLYLCPIAAALLTITVRPAGYPLLAAAAVLLYVVWAELLNLCLATAVLCIDLAMSLRVPLEAIAAAARVFLGHGLLPAVLAVAIGRLITFPLPVLPRADVTAFATGVGETLFSADAMAGDGPGVRAALLNGLDAASPRLEAAVNNITISALRAVDPRAFFNLSCAPAVHPGVAAAMDDLTAAARGLADHIDVRALLDPAVIRAGPSNATRYFDALRDAGGRLAADVNAAYVIDRVAQRVLSRESFAGIEWFEADGAFRFANVSAVQYVRMRVAGLSLPRTVAWLVPNARVVPLAGASARYVGVFVRCVGLPVLVVTLVVQMTASATRKEGEAAAARDDGRTHAMMAATVRAAKVFALAGLPLQLGLLALSRLLPLAGARYAAAAGALAANAAARTAAQTVLFALRPRAPGWVAGLCGAVAAAVAVEMGVVWRPGVAVGVAVGASAGVVGVLGVVAVATFGVAVAAVEWAVRRMQDEAGDGEKVERHEHVD